MERKSTFKLVGVVLACAVIGTIVMLVIKNRPVETPVYNDKRIIRFSYEVSNTTNKAVRNANFSTYLPVELLANQQAISNTASITYDVTGSENGNRVANFTFDLIPPFGKKKVVITSEVSTTNKPNSLAVETDVAEYLEPEKYIETTDTAIVKLAESLKGETDIDSMRKIFKWVSTRLGVSGYTSQDKGARYALESLQGDCTEHMYLVIALARVLNIPARGVGGYVYDSDRLAQSSDYHNWAEVYIDGVWNIVDSQKKTFMDQSQNYIGMRLISDAQNSLLGNSHRFLAVDDGIKVLMN